MYAHYPCYYVMHTSTYVINKILFKSYYDSATLNNIFVHSHHILKKCIYFFVLFLWISLDSCFRISRLKALYCMFFLICLIGDFDVSKFLKFRNPQSNRMI